jgi:orotate phosphoribosyltransferase-like protein
MKIFYLRFLNMPRKRSHLLLILALCLTVFVIPNSARSGLFKKPWADLEVDYLSEVVSQDLTYFDGTWSGYISCGPAGSSPGSTPYAEININQGNGNKEIGVKGKRGYVRWKANILRNGKFTLKGKYYWEGWKTINYSGQIGVDPHNPFKEIMWFKGKRGPRTCKAKLERKLPLSAMNVLSYKIPKLRATLDKQNKGAGPMATQKVEIKPTEPKDKVLANNETQKDVIPPQIVIFSHDTSRAINVVQKQKKINIKGRATDKNGIVEVIVNNKEASLGEKGNFDVDIYLGMGKNKIVVRAMDTFENVADKTFTITRAASDVAKADADSKTAAGSYFALVIGNNNYRYIRKLETAKRDARDIAQTLKKVYGFEVKLLLDATRNDTVQAINTIRKSLKENDNLLIYYAGHGEFDKTANKAYWLPVDARSDDDTNWILADRITSNIRRISSKHILVVADSCYSGTFTRRAVTDLSSSQARDRYLKKMQAKKSRTILASGGYEPVSDIGGKGHSVFAAALLNGLKQMEKNTFSAEELFYDHIKERVAGNADQTPEYNIIRNSGHDGGDFVFKRINNY